MRAADDTRDPPGADARPGAGETHESVTGRPRHGRPRSGLRATHCGGRACGRAVAPSRAEGDRGGVGDELGDGGRAGVDEAGARGERRLRATRRADQRAPKAGGVEGRARVCEPRRPPATTAAATLEPLTVTKRECRRPLPPARRSRRPTPGPRGPASGDHRSRAPRGEAAGPPPATAPRPAAPNEGARPPAAARLGARAGQGARRAENGYARRSLSPRPPAGSPSPARARGAPARPREQRHAGCRPGATSAARPATRLRPFRSKSRPAARGTATSSSDGPAADAATSSSSSAGAARGARTDSERRRATAAKVGRADREHGRRSSRAGDRPNAGPAGPSFPAATTRSESSARALPRHAPAARRRTPRKAPQRNERRCGRRRERRRPVRIDRALETCEDLVGPRVEGPAPTASRCQPATRMGTRSRRAPHRAGLPGDAGDDPGHRRPVPLQAGLPGRWRACVGPAVTRSIARQRVRGGTEWRVDSRVEQRDGYASVGSRGRGHPAATVDRDGRRGGAPTRAGNATRTG